MKVNLKYCGFHAEELNSNQQIPSKTEIVYYTIHFSWALEYAKNMRNKFGINLWLDGTVCKGWKILVHKDDKERALNMFENIK